VYGDPQILHVDQVLTQISVAYRNPEYQGSIFFPALPVDKQSDKYLVEDRNYAMTVVEDLRGPGAQTHEVPPMGLSRDSYFAEEHSLKDWVAIEEPANADPGFDVMGRATQRTTDWILFNRENFMQAMLRTAANYATGHTVTLAGTSQWSDYTNSDPIGDLKDAVEKVYFATGRQVNVTGMGREVATILEDHPDFLDRMKTTPLAENRSLSAVADLTGIGTITRLGAIANSAALGLTPSYSYLWGKDVILANVPPSPSRDEPAFAYEFVWSGPEGETQPVDRWYDNDRKSWAVRTTRRYDLKFISVDAVATGKATGGYLIKAAIA